MNRALPTPQVQALLLVATGAVPGALLRWHWSGRESGTLAANLLATLLLGALLPWQPRHPRLWLLAGVGFCGSLSTFSTWVLELEAALQTGQPLNVLRVLFSQLLGGMLAISVGVTLSRALLRWQTRLR